MMVVAKQVADLLTLTRALLVFIFAWFGVTRGAEALPFAALLLVYSWVSDSIDGPIARRSREKYHTWLGDHDLEIDMAFAGGVLVYLVASDYVPFIHGLAYVLLWLLIFSYWGLHRSLGMLSQAPIYAGFILVCLRDAFPYGIIQVVFILAVLILTWPRFPQEIIPGFLVGLMEIRKGPRQS